MGLFDRLKGNSPAPDAGMVPDYAEWETKLASAAVQNQALHEWLDGNPDFNKLAVKFQIIDGEIYARFGEFGMCLIGKETKALEDVGYRFEVEHYREFWNDEDGETLLLRPQQAIHNVPIGVTFVYKARPNAKPGIEVDEEDHDHAEETKGGYVYSHHALDTQPEPQGGMTKVRVYAPSGHWAEGAAFCDDIDNYENIVGRTYALFRALEGLNEVRGV